MTDRINRASGESGVPGGMSAAREPEPTFKPGDRVVCVDASASGGLLTPGGVSIVAEVNELDALLRMTSAEQWWCAERFLHAEQPNSDPARESPAGRTVCGPEHGGSDRDVSLRLRGAVGVLRDIADPGNKWGCRIVSLAARPARWEQDTLEIRRVAAVLATEIEEDTP